MDSSEIVLGALGLLGMGAGISALSGRRDNPSGSAWKEAEHPVFAHAVRVDGRIKQTYDFVDEEGDTVPMMRETPSQSEGEPTWNEHYVSWAPSWFEKEKGLSFHHAKKKMKKRVNAINLDRYRSEVEGVIVEGEKYAPDEVEWLLFVG